MRSAGAVGAVACAAPQGLIFSTVIHRHVAQYGLKAVDKQRGSTPRASPLICLYFNQRLPVYFLVIFVVFLFKMHSGHL